VAQLKWCINMLLFSPLKSGCVSKNGTARQFGGHFVEFFFGRCHHVLSV
jgi:hypothetical protein